MSQIQWWCCLVLLLCGVGALAEEAAPVALTPVWNAGQFSGIEAVECAIISKTNEERRARNFSSLRLSPELQVAARQHSHEMGEKNYFDHASPETAWRMPWQRTYYAGYWGYQVGENLLAISLKDDELQFPDTLAAKCVQMWMDSPAHRRDLLDAKWTFTGIGVTQVGTTLYCTQLFAAPVVTIEHAEVAPTTGELVQLQIDGALSTGTVAIGVNGQCVQMLFPRRGAFTATLSYPRASGCYEIEVGVNSLQCWSARLDTGRPAKDALAVTQIVRSGPVTHTAVTTTRFTGMRLTGDVRASAAQQISVLRDGVVIADLTPDTTGRASFNVLLPKSDDLYTISFMVDGLTEDLLYLDTNKPLAAAFRCRPK